MALVYDIPYIAGLLLASPVLAYRMLRTGKWRTDWSARFGRCDAAGRRDDRPTLLIHAVSVGEVNATRLLVERLHAASDGRIRIVISTTTDTGTARARQLFEPAHTVVRYPFDFSAAVDRFLDTIRPDAVALVELEVWPNFVLGCSKRNVPVVVINGRLSARSFKRYRLIRPIIGPTFARLDAVAAQTPDYAERFVDIGVPAERVSVSDTMKWDTAQIEDAAAVPGADRIARAMGINPDRPLIVAGSTAPGEELMLINTCPPEAQLMLVPRKPERFDEVAALSPGIIRRTEHRDNTARAVDDQRIFLLDTMGELRKAYALCSLAIIGRSFVPLYGSDPIESVALGKPTIIGPHHADFADTVNALREGGGIEVTDKPGQLAEQLLSQPQRIAALADNGRRVILSRQGATERHARMLLDRLNLAAAAPI